MAVMIYNASFNKGDYRLNIKYWTNGDTYNLSTNDSPLKSLDLAVETVRNAVAEYFQIDTDNNYIAIESIIFTAEADTIKYTVNEIGSYPEKLYKASCKIEHIRKSEVCPAEGRLKLIQAVEDVKNELERFVKGERLQQELSV